MAREERRLIPGYFSVISLTLALVLKQLALVLKQLEVTSISAGLKIICAEVNSI